MTDVNTAPVSAVTKPYQANFTLPAVLLSSMEFLLQHYADKHLRLDRQLDCVIPSPVPGRQYLLYAHIPFCHTLCTYCTFHRFLFREELARRYFCSLRAEMLRVKELGYDFNAMYLGGGTPTVLEDELIRTIEHAKTLFPGIKEVSCETDPLHLDHPGFRQLEGLVDRMSVGVQSFNDDILKQIERFEKFGSGQQIFDKIMAIKALFPIVNVDLIFGFRAQTPEVMQQDLARVLQLAPRQITTYPLMVTQQTRHSVRHGLAAPQTEMTAQYRQVLNSLNGPYKQLSSWAFGKMDDEGFDEYVIDHDEYLGVGSGSFSFLNNTLYVNTFSLHEYQRRIAAGRMSVELQRTYSRAQVMRYRFLMGMFSGRLSKRYFRETFGVDLEWALLKEIWLMRALDAIKKDPADPDYFTVTDNGRLLASIMMKTFYSGMDKVRAQLRKPLKPCDM